MPTPRQRLLLHRVNKINLPRYLLNRAGVEAEGFESHLDWSMGAGSAATNTTGGQFRTGSASVKFTSSAVEAFATKTVNIPPGTKGDWSHCRLYYYLHSTLADYLSIAIKLANSDWSKYVTGGREITAKNSKIGWNCWDIYKSDWANTGGLSTADTIARVRFTMASRTGNVVEASLDQLLFDVDSVPAAFIAFDDIRPSVYDYAYAYMRTKMARATVYAISGSIDAGGFMTSAQLVTMYGEGWDIGNHSFDHADLTTLTQGEVEDELTQCQGTLDGLGLTRASKHVAYPGGTSSETVRAAMTATGMLTGRTNDSAYIPNISADSSYVLGIWFPANSSTLAQVKAYVDTAISDRKIFGLGFHVLTTGAPAPLEWGSSNFIQLVDYIVNRRIPFVTVSDMYKSLSSPIEVPLLR